MARRAEGTVLELGCGTGRVTIPVARTGASVVGVDRSVEMLRFARRRASRARLKGHVSLLRGDIRSLPFRDPAPFSLVMAPYGILQSLVSDSDLSATLASVERVLTPGGMFGLDLVPDVPVVEGVPQQSAISWLATRWKDAHHAGGICPAGSSKKLTVFDQEYIEQRGAERKSRRFSLVFRTLTVPQVTRRLERAGFRIRAVLGDYSGEPWDPRADVWLILAEKQ